MDTTLLLTSEQVSKWLHCGSFLCHHLDFSLWFPRLIYWSLLFFSFTWSFTGLEFINFEQIDVRRWVKDVASLIISFWGGLATLAMVFPWIAPGAGVVPLVVLVHDLVLLVLWHLFQLSCWGELLLEGLDSTTADSGGLHSQLQTHPAHSVAAFTALRNRHPPPQRVPTNPLGFPQHQAASVVRSTNWPLLDEDPFPFLTPQNKGKKRKKNKPDPWYCLLFGIAQKKKKFLTNVFLTSPSNHQHWIQRNIRCNLAEDHIFSIISYETIQVQENGSRGTHFANS